MAAERTYSGGDAYFTTSNLYGRADALKNGGPGRPSSSTLAPSTEIVYDSQGVFKRRNDGVESTGRSETYLTFRPFPSWCLMGVQGAGPVQAAGPVIGETSLHCA